MITQEYLKSVLNYDPQTGIWTWAITKSRRMPKGKRAGTIRSKDGREVIKLDGVDYLAYRLAWLYMTGEWPKDQIDHINVDKSDSRFGNLRQATRSQNHANKPSPRKNGLKGTQQRGRRWSARIKVNQRVIHLGSFDTQEAAHDAYCTAARLHFGEYARP